MEIEFEDPIWNLAFTAIIQAWERISDSFLNPRSALSGLWRNFLFCSVFNGNQVILACLPPNPIGSLTDPWHPVTQLFLFSSNSAWSSVLHPFSASPVASGIVWFWIILFCSLYGSYLHPNGLHARSFIKLGVFQNDHLKQSDSLLINSV